jgi:SOS-response transcriptional repressor LexA
MRVTETYCQNDNIFDVDVNSLINTKSSSFVKINGNDYSNLFIYDGDMIIVDSGIQLYDSARVLVSTNGKLSIKIYRIIDNCKYIQGENYSFLPLEIGDMRFDILGTVTGIIHNNKY